MIIKHIKNMRLRRLARYTLQPLCLLALQTGPQAAPIYHWTDAEGQVHFSDLPPAGHTATAVTRHIMDSAASQTLRPGELATLSHIEQRQRARQQRVAASRRKHRQAREAHERSCRERREQLRRGRRHVDGKALSKYLRAHCW